MRQYSNIYPQSTVRTAHFFGFQVERAQSATARSFRLKIWLSHAALYHRRKVIKLKFPWFAWASARFIRRTDRKLKAL